MRRQDTLLVFRSPRLHRQAARERDMRRPRTLPCGGRRLSAVIARCRGVDDVRVNNNLIKAFGATKVLGLPRSY